MDLELADMIYKDTCQGWTLPCKVLVVDIDQGQDLASLYADLEGNYQGLIVNINIDN